GNSGRTRRAGSGHRKGLGTGRKGRDRGYLAPGAGKPDSSRRRTSRRRTQEEGLSVGAPPPEGPGMNVSEIFIRKPIATSLLMVAIAVFGVLSYGALAVSDLPNVDFPTLT